MEVGGEGDYILYLSLHYHHHNDLCIKMGSDESHFNVSVGRDGQITRQCPQTTIFEEKGEPKRCRTEVLPLQYQPNALPLGQTGSLGVACSRPFFYVVVFCCCFLLLFSFIGDKLTLYGVV